MSPRSVFITGCSMGVGFGLVRQATLVEKPPKHLFAVDKLISNDLKELSEKNTFIRLIEMDMTDHTRYPDIVKEVGEVVGDRGLNLLINNAGYLPANRELKSVTPQDMRDAYEINCIAPLFFAKAMLPLLKSAAKAHEGSPMSLSKACIIQMTSMAASIGENHYGQNYAYRCSKAALNQSMRTLSIDLKDTGILILGMHPGWVATNMGGLLAEIDLDTSISAMMKSFAELNESHYGKYLNYDSKPIPW